MNYRMQIAPNPSILLISTNKKFVGEITEITRGNLGTAPKGAKEIAEKLLEIEEIYTLQFDEEGRIEIDAVEEVDWDQIIPQIENILDLF
ncbi:MAG: NifU N-terminal domain-containing protein [Candidatus Pacebacteria bacterium]|nr:NifU N-terminal domain-containing protein [Candidatus Paceibacterota bacterium]MBP9058097.1 NifU N-terminal domain-containing protein [Candidatus Paceibacterota bacterium]MBP9769991.1 NifU N-terminal domain-containing protein [Candidatus Paceibacterota bacterium]